MDIEYVVRTSFKKYKRGDVIAPNADVSPIDLKRWCTQRPVVVPQPEPAKGDAGKLGGN